MHEDLERLDRVDQLDRESARLQSTIELREAALREAEATLTAQREALEQAVSRVAENRAAQVRLQRKQKEYQSNRDAATRLLETGQGDPDAAERQVQRSGELIDAVETEILELLEAQDELDAAHATAADTVARSEAQVKALQVEVPEVRAELTSRMGGVKAERDAVFAGLPKHVARRYADWRARNKWAVARMVDGTCDACRMQVPAQHRADLMRGLMEPCHRCKRWLVPPEDPAPGG